MLYHGGFSPGRGIDVIVAALREPALATVHAAFLGYGTLHAELERLAAMPECGGRIHVLDAVPPGDLPDWVAGADVAVMPILGSTLNHRLSTPNKLFEALAAGVPVVASDLPGMREIVTGDPGGPLGELCDPTSPADVARAIGAILERPAAERAELRRRCLAAAHARWNWESQVPVVLAEYERLTGRPW